ncbi:MAG: two-component system CheB/CheR fusion protein, partial [Phenylobacterium sp.]
MAKQPTPNRPDMKNFPILALGASAGGLEAFETFFKAMSHDSGLAFVLIAHLDPSHASLLPELLQKRSKMKVRQIQDGMKVEANHVYVIPPNKELTINNGVLQLMELTQPRGSNLAIDAFFQALAKDQGSNAIAIVLSGTGTDGTLGLKAIKGETGMVMAQDEQSAKYDGMPRSAIATGLVDYVLPPNEMPAQLLKYIEHAWQKNRPSLCVDDKVTPDALQKIYIILRTQTDHDFSLYKKNTICRRIERRMNVHQIDDIEDYARYLQDNEREINILFKELLIGVTNFFRDFEAFEALRKDYLYNMLKEKPQDYTIRVWVTGCSSGEEAYSLAIILQECMLALKRHFNVQIFATDIDEEAINVARAGVYPQSIHADVSSQRLKRYFTKEDDGRYRIKKAIREMLVFAPQNVIKDPPFTKLDI